jgi:hypothetical protein
MCDKEFDFSWVLYRRQKCPAIVAAIVAEISGWMRRHSCLAHNAASGCGRIMYAKVADIIVGVR